MYRSLALVQRLRLRQLSAAVGDSAVCLVAPHPIELATATLAHAPLPPYHNTKVRQDHQASPYFDPTLARAGLANRLLDRHEVVTGYGDVVTLRQATP